MHHPEGVITVTGREPGKTLCIMAGVHGNEPCGIRIFEELISNHIKIERGVVHFIYGNPKAIERNERFIEMNLNRAFRPDDEMLNWEKDTYERHRALELIPFLRESHALLDIHSSFTKESTPFIICEPQSFSIARKFPFPIRSHGWDVIEPGGTDYFVNRCGGYGMCVECGQHLDSTAIRRAEIAIRNFFILMGVIEGATPLENTTQREIHVCGIYHTKVDYVPARDFADFDPISAGELIGHDGNEDILAPFSGVIIFGTQRRTKPKEEAFILGRERES